MSMSATETTAAYIAVGASDGEVCFCCGRTNLRRTILIAPVNADGEVTTGEAAPYGTTCAARATGRPSRELTAEAAAADHRRAAAVAEAAAFAAGIRAEWGEYADESPALFAADLADQAARRAAHLGDTGYHGALKSALLAL